MVTGRSPSTLLDGVRLRWEELCMDLPISLQHWLDRMLAVDPKERFASAQEALSEMPLVEHELQEETSEPLVVEISDDFVSMLSDKKSEKRQQEERARRVFLAKQEARRKKEEEEKQKRIAEEREKQDAARYREEMLRQIKNEESLLVVEM